MFNVYATYFVVYLENTDELFCIHRDDSIKIELKGKGPFVWLGEL